jgi:26S proteasome regulatory subunit N9
MVFKRSSDDRNLSFSDIATETRLPLVEVEYLLMKAMSLSIIKGKIHQIDQMVCVDWVQPRVLETTQIALMTGKISEWTTKVLGLSVDIEKEAPELFV